MDGGVTAARGFRYQYLITLRDLLIIAENPLAKDHSVHLEGGTGTGAGSSGEVIDYAVATDGGELTRVVQVKCRESGRTMQPNQVAKIFFRLTQSDSQTYILATNSRMSSNTIDSWKKIRSAESSMVRSELMRTLSAAGFDAEFINKLDDKRVQRFQRCEIQTDEGSVEELAEGLLARITLFRERRSCGRSNKASSMLMGLLVDRIFTLASSHTSRELRVQSLLDIVYTDNLSLASAAGRFEWGIPIGPCPVKDPDVPRPELLGKMRLTLRTPLESRSVATCVLVGLSGTGKSSLAAAYAREYADDYDLIVWINAETESAVRHGMLDLIEILTGSRDHKTDEAAAQAVIDLLGRLPDRWLMIFDNARDGSYLSRWRPSLGRGAVIVTSTNQITWSGMGAIIPVSSMSKTQASRLLANRLQLDSENLSPIEISNISLLVDGLTAWPLALELAAGYLTSTQSGLTGSAEYITRVRAQILNDPRNLPNDYPHPLIAAINIALEEVGRIVPAGEQRVIFTLFLASCSYLSHQEIPCSLVLAAALEKPIDEFAGGLARALEFSERAILDEILRTLGTFSLIQRRQRKLLEIAALHDPGSTLDLLSMNEIVQEVIRLSLADVENPNFHLLKHIAQHVNFALVAATDAGEAQLLALLEPHIFAMVNYTTQLGIETEGITALYGNFAATRLSRGFPQEAVQLCALERAILKSSLAEGWEKRWLYTAQLGTVELNALLEIDADGETVKESVSQTLEALERLTDDLASNFKDGGLFCRQLVANLDLMMKRRETLDAKDLGERARALITKFPVDQDKVDRSDLLNRLNQLVHSDPDEAIRILTTDEKNFVSLVDRVMLVLLFAEAYARKHDYVQFENHLEIIQEISKSQPFYASTIVERLLNSVAPLVMPFLQGMPPFRRGENTRLGEMALELAAENLRRISPSDYDVSRFHLYQGLVHLASFDREKAETSLSQSDLASDVRPWSVSDIAGHRRILKMARELLQVAKMADRILWVAHSNRRRTSLSVLASGPALMLDLEMDEETIREAGLYLWVVNPRGEARRVEHTASWIYFPAMEVLALIISVLGADGRDRCALVISFDADSGKQTIAERFLEVEARGFDMLISCLNSENYHAIGNLMTEQRVSQVHVELLYIPVRSTKGLVDFKSTIETTH